MANRQLYLTGLLMEMKFSPRYLGYLYLQSIAELILDNPVYLKSLCKYVYPVVGKRYNAKLKSVEKAVDNAISRAYKRGGLKDIATDRCPSNKEVISYLVTSVTQYEMKVQAASVLKF